MTRVPILRAVYFVWVVVPGGLYFAYLALGDPYIIWSWTASPYGRYGYASFSGGHHLSCTYVGWPGLLHEQAEAGQCAAFRFSKAAWG